MRIVLNVGGLLRIRVKKSIMTEIERGWFYGLINFKHE